MNDVYTKQIFNSSNRVSLCICHSFTALMRILLIAYSYIHFYMLPVFSLQLRINYRLAYIRSDEIDELGMRYSSGGLKFSGSGYSIFNECQYSHISAP